MSTKSSASMVENFGGNLRFQPAAVFTPESESELLEILRSRRGKRIRCLGSRHSWSDVLVGEEVVIDTRCLNRVTVHDDGDQPWAEIEAGCQVKQALAELARQGGYTLPTLGLITEQTIAGASATGTHGSGRHSISHYVQSASIVDFDPATQEPRVRCINDGDELRAVRCGLGCLGIVTSVRIPIRKQYMIEEVIYRYNTLDEVLRQEAKYPLQQFFLVPWRWDFYGQQRIESTAMRSTLAWLYRLYWSLIIDVGLHLIVLLLVSLLPRFCTRVFFGWTLPCLVPQGWKVVDRSDRQLTMHHELFRHIEIELFVTRPHLKSAVDYAIWLTRHCGGERVEPDPNVRARLQAGGHWESLEQLRGVYLQHYPICIRSVLPDNTLISMTAGLTETSYALSFIAYSHPTRREGFYRFAQVLAATMAELFDARPHWGKYCPLAAAELKRLYPNMDRFVEICEQSGSRDRFTNRWIEAIFDVPVNSTSSA